MGSCVSLHKGTASAAKLRLSIGSKNEEILIPSPVKEKPDVVNDGELTAGDLAIKSHWSSAAVHDEGSTNEAFFDSQPWLESDCEDDFFSVSGDTPSRTPSCGTTPVHHSLHLPKLNVNKSPVAQETNNTSDPKPSPSDKKKRLSELFRESLRGDEQYTDLAALTSQNGRASNVTNGTPYLSGDNSLVASGESTPNQGPRAVDRSSKTAQCCLPGLLSSKSFNERRKRMSPAHAVGAERMITKKFEHIV